MSNTICYKKLFLLLFTIATAPRMESTVSAHSHIPSPSSLNSSSAPYAPSLPPTTHHLLHLIITPSTSPLLLPWQQQCWAQVPMSPVVTSLPLTITIHYIKIKSANHFFYTADGHSGGGFVEKNQKRQRFIFLNHSVKTDQDCFYQNIVIFAKE